MNENSQWEGLAEDDRALAHSSDVRRAHLSRGEGAGLVTVQAWLGETAQLGCAGGHEEDCRGLEHGQAVCSTQQSKASQQMGQCSFPIVSERGGNEQKLNNFWVTH